MCQHFVHVSCLAGRQIPCPHCRTPWTEADAASFANLATELGVEVQAPAAAPREASPIVAQRLPPRSYVVLCCPQVRAVRDHPNAQLQLIPDYSDRRCQWIGGQGVAWHGEWVCLTCQNSVQTDDPLLMIPNERPACPSGVHHFRDLMVDLQDRSRYWCCSRMGSALEVPFVEERCGMDPLPDLEMPSNGTIDLVSDEDRDDSMPLAEVVAEAEFNEIQNLFQAMADRSEVLGEMVELDTILSQD